MFNFHQYKGPDKDHPHKGWHKRISVFQPAQNCRDMFITVWNCFFSKQDFKIQMSWIKRGTGKKRVDFFPYYFLKCELGDLI